MNKSKSSITQRIQSFVTAFRGIEYAIKSELHVKVHLFAALLVIICGFYFHISQEEWLAVIISIAMVLMAELFNTAIELIGDYLSKDFDEQIGKIKDIAAGAVLVTSICAMIIGILVFYPLIYSS
ncbi:MAG: diacylglycerol kinase family protein [Flavobacteriales bacterium]|nr:diacylglycerol kinase family protein [Flavobacteriales bacterium]